MAESFNKMSSPEPTSSEQLVAFLDGELEEQERLAVEARLAADAALREEISRLEQAWDLLDTLPETEAGQNFTQTTVEMVAVRAAEEADPSSARAMVSRWGKRLALAGLFFGLTAAGYALVALRPDPNELLLRHYRIIKHLDALESIPDVEFLRKLNDPELFGEEESLVEFNGDAQSD